MRQCNTCQHLKRPEIDRRLAGGEPVAQVARDYDLNPSSLHRHRTNCLKLASSNQIKKDAARGSAAIELLQSKETLSSAYLELRARIDQVVEQAQEQRSLNVAISGLNSIRQTLDSLARLAGHLQPASTQVNVAVQNNVNVGAVQIAERLIQAFDHEPETKARIARVLLVLTARQVGKTTQPPLAWRIPPPLWVKSRHVQHPRMSALPPKADMCGANRDVRFVPIADIRSQD